MRTTLLAFGVACLCFTLAHYATISVFAVLADRSHRRSRPARRLVALAATITGRAAPGVSVIMPAYNEANLIVDTVMSALSQRYHDIEVIVVNDGSTDATIAILTERFGIEPVDPWSPVGAPPVGVEQIPTAPVRAVYRTRGDRRLIVLDKESAGSKGDAANAGLNYATKPWCVMMDGDEFMERDAIARCMVEVAADPDHVLAVGGTLLPSNGIVIDGADVVERSAPTNYWVGCQLAEYLNAFLISRPGLALLRALPIVSGGYGVFRVDAVREAGGYRHGHLGEDMDLMVRLQRTAALQGGPSRVVQVPEAVCWTEFPSTRPVLRRQRIRWHRGLKQVIDDHGQMIGKRRYGRIGTVGLGSLYVFEWIGPLLEAVGWAVLLLMLWLGWANPVTVGAAFVATQTFGMAAAVLAVLMAVRQLPQLGDRRDLWRMICWALLFNWGYRQLSLWWRIRSLAPGSYVWGEMPRVGLKRTISSPS